MRYYRKALVLLWSWPWCSSIKYIQVHKKPYGDHKNGRMGQKHVCALFTVRCRYVALYGKANSVFYSLDAVDMLGYMVKQPCSVIKDSLYALYSLFKNSLLKHKLETHMM